MAEHTTITVSNDLKADLAADKPAGETWNEYLRRLHEGSPAREPTGDVASMDPDRLRTVVREALEEQDVSERDRTDEGIDYDCVREIVREEVRRVLEDVIR